ncbi:hypothetical protein SBDP1_1160025 [Syntrophobacter sp. SbD1]|nr:hypothetical protein SBDP1_1160025 [Syntrophobacter sp. SbD1]
MRVGGDDTEPLLVGEYLLAHLFPAHVELALELVDPLLRRLVWRVASARNVIDEEWLVGRSGVQSPNMIDRLVCQISGEVVTGLADPWIHLGLIAKKVGRPLVGLAAQEAVEILKAHADRPLVEGARQTVLEARRVVVFAEPRGGIAVVSENRADGRILRSDVRVIARETGGQLRDHAEAHRVVVAPGDQRGARGRTQRGGVELCIAQSRRGASAGVGMTPPKVLETP